MVGAVGAMGMVNFPRKDQKLAEDMAKALLCGVRQLVVREKSRESGQVDQDFVAYLRCLAAETEDYLNGREAPTADRD